MFIDSSLNYRSNNRGSSSSGYRNRIRGGNSRQNPQGGDEPYGYRGGSVEGSPSILGGQVGKSTNNYTSCSGVVVSEAQIDNCWRYKSATSFHCKHHWDYICRRPRCTGNELPGALPNQESGLGGAGDTCQA